MYVGLDFGTTNSSVSIYDGSTVTLLPLDPFSANPQRHAHHLVYCPGWHRPQTRAW
jgi:molecular chaperone DnaK (HSP70)